MSLYGRYIQEREGFEILESDKGFATYLISGPECYIRDIYVSPAYRKSHLARQMADEITKIAKNRDCKYLSGSVSPNAKGATTSIQVLINYGFKLVKSTPDIIWFKKDI